MDKFELQKLRDLPIEGVAERLGLRVSRHKSLCPFHDDRHPSLSFNTRRNTYRCFVCGEHGGTIDLAMKMLSTGFREACRWLADSHNVIIDEYKPSVKEDTRGTFDPVKYQRFFEHPWLNDAARAFLYDERKIDERVVRWCRINSYTDRHGIPWLQTPYYDMEGKLIGVQSRNLGLTKDPLCPLGHLPLNGENEVTSERFGAHCASHLPIKGEAGEGPLLPRFRFPYGSRCSIYNLPVLKLLQRGEELWITEGCSDCWAMLSSGHKAIAIPSATLLSANDKTVLAELSSRLSTQFHMYPDQDLPGEQLFLQLQKVVPSITRHQLPKGCKDYADYYALQKR